MHTATSRFLAASFLSLAAFVMPACAAETSDGSPAVGSDDVTSVDRNPLYAKIRDAARASGVGNAYLLAGLAMHESAGFNMCWDGRNFCPGPNSPDCGGRPIMAGGGDGPCSVQQGGLGLFQFDDGTYAQTIRTYGEKVLTVTGQVESAIDFVVRMVKNSVYTTDAETDDKSKAWINRFDINNKGLRDQWIKTVLRYYNGCQPDWSCFGQRYPLYDDALSRVLTETGGAAFWAAGSTSGSEGGSTTGGTCPGSSVTVAGPIGEKYKALGGCSSFLGVPKLEEQGTPDGIGRYNVFDRGSIYWTAELGAWEVHGILRDKWKETGWEAGPLGYPITDETATSDGSGRYNDFEHGAIYFTEATGAHAVLGVILEEWKETGAEEGPLGYPTSDEYVVSQKRKVDFQKGSITWDPATGRVTVKIAAAN